MDFKLLDSQTKLMAVSILKEQPIVFASGLVAYIECKKTGGKVRATRLHVAMRGLSVDGLVNARCAKTNCTNVQNDIPQVLEVVEAKKHILMQTRKP